mgnify:CR=1 FL=1
MLVWSSCVEVFLGGVEGVEIIYVADAETKIIPELSQRPEERLNALIEEDPSLGKAVEELNLELLD